MDRLMIRYRVKPDQLGRHLGLLRAVYAELAAIRPDGLRFATLRLPDQLSFVDIAVGPDLPGPLPQLQAFRDFRADLEQRCDERIVTEFVEVGSFGWKN